MNDLSWFLYLADILPNAASFLGGMSGMVAIFGGVGLIFWYIASLEEKEEYKPKTFLVYLYFFILFLGLLTLLVPSRETIYLIAGSEAGEYVVQSETGQEILNDIHQVIKQQLNELKGD